MRHYCAVHRTILSAHCSQTKGREWYNTVCSNPFKTILMMMMIIIIFFLFCKYMYVLSFYNSTQLYGYQCALNLGL